MHFANVGLQERSWFQHFLISSYNPLAWLSSLGSSSLVICGRKQLTETLSLSLHSLKKKKLRESITSSEFTK